MAAPELDLVAGFMEKIGGKPPSPNRGERDQNLRHRECLDVLNIAEEEILLTEEEHWTSSTMGRDRSRESFSLLTPH